MAVRHGSLYTYPSECEASNHGDTASRQGPTIIDYDKLLSLRPSRSTTFEEGIIDWTKLNKYSVWIQDSALYTVFIVFCAVHGCVAEGIKAALSSKNG